MASSKARSRNRPAAAKSGRPAAGKGPSASRAGNGSAPATARTQQAAGQETGPAGAAGRQKAQATRAKRQLPEVVPEPARPAGPPFWLQVVTLVLALGGLGVSIYETWAHYHGSTLFACTGSGTVDCTKVITSPQSMVFGVIPVAILGVVFYVFVVAIMSPWAWQMKPWEVRLGRRRWRIERHQVNLVRLATMIVGMGFVLYLLYAELYQIGSICLYCTSVHAITFCLFAITVVSAAIWGLGKPKTAA